jgi:hypothetical protein
VLASLLLLATEEVGGEVEEHVDDPTWLTAGLAVVAVLVALYLLAVFLRTPVPSDHGDGHGDDHGDGDHADGHGDHAHAGAAHH